MKRDILVGDVREQLATLHDASVDCVVTSPPYWMLRDYGVMGQLGMEPTWREHIASLRDVFREVHRILKPTGNLWVNYGDTVSVANGGNQNAGSWISKGRLPEGAQPPNAPNRLSKADSRKHKLGLAWRLRFMLNDDLSFISRSDIVWHKPNSMPLSMKDRATPKYEMLFHLVKQPRYYFDLDAIRSPLNPDPRDSWTARLARGTRKKMPPGQKMDALHRFNVRVRDAQRGISDMKWGTLAGAGPEEVAKANERDARMKTLRDEARDDHHIKLGGGWKNGNRPKTGDAPELGPARDKHLRPAPEPGEAGAFHPLGANPGDVWFLDEENAVGSETWTIHNQPLAEAHFATYPEELVRRCLAASCPRAICQACGEPRRNTYEHALVEERGSRQVDMPKHKAAIAAGSHRPPGADHAGIGWSVTRRTGTTGCACGAPTVPGVVLDPFAGSFTTCLVAAKMGLGFVGIELNEAYVAIGRKRLAPYMRPLSSFDV